MAHEAARAAAHAAVNAEMARQQIDAAELARAAQVDVGTVRDFLSGERWPRTSSRGKLEKALGWPAGAIGRIASGVPVEVATMSDAPVAPRVGAMGDADPVRALLAVVPDEELLAEIARRFAGRGVASASARDVAVAQSWGFPAAAGALPDEGRVAAASASGDEGEAE